MYSILRVTASFHERSCFLHIERESREIFTLIDPSPFTVHRSTLMNIQVTVHNFSYNSESRRVLYYLQSILLFAQEKGKTAVKRTQAVWKRNERKLKPLLNYFFSFSFFLIRTTIFVTQLKKHVFSLALEIIVLLCLTIIVLWIIMDWNTLFLQYHQNPLIILGHIKWNCFCKE